MLKLTIAVPPQMEDPRSMLCSKAKKPLSASSPEVPVQLPTIGWILPMLKTTIPSAPSCSFPLGFLQVAFILRIFQVSRNSSLFLGLAITKNSI